MGKKETAAEIAARKKAYEELNNLNYGSYLQSNRQLLGWRIGIVVRLTGLKRYRMEKTKYGKKISNYGFGCNHVLWVRGTEC